MLLGILISLVAVLAARVLWRRWKYDLHKIPSPPGLPLVGHLFTAFTSSGRGTIHRFIGLQWKAMGQPRLMKLTLLGQPLLCVCDIQTARNLLSTKKVAIERSELGRQVVIPLIGGDRHVKCLIREKTVSSYAKEVRRVYANGLQSSTLRHAMPNLHSVLDKMTRIIDAEAATGPIDFQKLCVKMTLDSIGVLALDTNLGGLDNSRQLYQSLVGTGHVCGERYFNIAAALSYTVLPFSERERKKDAVIDALTAEWKALADEVLARKDPPAGEEPIWHLLRTLKDPDTGEPLEYSSLVAELATVVLGGMDTTGHQLPCILALVAAHPGVMDKIVAELKEHGHYESGCRNMTLEDVGNLPYVAAVVKEGIRLSHVSLSAPWKDICEDTNVLGYRIPKGTPFIVPTIRWMNSEADWGDPDAFRPERWLEGDDKSQAYYNPFSYGPQDCPGQKLAILEMRVAIARLVQRYNFTLEHPVETILNDNRIGFVIESANGILLHAHPRN